MNSSTDKEVHDSPGGEATSHRAPSGNKKSTQSAPSSVKQALAQFDKLPQPMRIGIFVVVAGVTASLLGSTVSFVGSVFNTDAHQSGPAYQQPQQSVAPVSPGAPAVGAEAPNNPRKSLWDQVGISYRNLNSRVGDVADANRQAMAQTLRQEATLKCSQLGPTQCRSEFQLLMQEFLAKYAELLSYTTSLTTAPGATDSTGAVPVDKMVLNRDTIQQYRKAQNDLLDLAAALSQNPNGDTPQFVPTVDLNSSLREFASALQNYEVLRGVEAESAYNSPPDQQSTPDTPVAPVAPAQPAAAAPPPAQAQ